MESLTGGCYGQPSPSGLCSSPTQQSPSIAGHDKNHLKQDLFWTIISVYYWLTSLAGEYQAKG